MTEWVSRQHTFFGMFDRKVSSIALVNLLQHALRTDDPRLKEITVKGDLIETKQMITRSKRKPEEWSRIPLLIKIFKLLIYEMSCLMLDTSGDDGGETSSDSEDEDKENEYDGTGGYGDDQFYDDDENGLNIDDQDVLSDPLYVVDLYNYLKDFLVAFSQQPYFPEFASHTNPQEKKILAKIGIQG